jgi:hypothetical protein
VLTLHCLVFIVAELIQSHILLLFEQHNIVPNARTWSRVATTIDNVKDAEELLMLIHQHVNCFTLNYSIIICFVLFTGIILESDEIVGTTQ